MDADFWHSKWEKNEIGFHQNKPNDLFTRHSAARRWISAGCCQKAIPSPGPN